MASLVPIQDNTNAKILFVVRNPVERMYSAFKQTYSTYAKVGNFDDFILPGIGVMEHKFSQLREMVTNGTAPDEVIRYYYEHSYEDVPQRAELFMPSLYALPIARYMSVFGAGNVKVVTAEDLDVRDQARLDETLNAVFSFIGGCLLAMRRVICCCGLCLAPTRLYVVLL
jgi:hypothetical protein